jgi:glucoselysine-6-phosphate deglycase
MKWMIDYVKDAPEICKNMVKNRKEITKDLVKKYTSKKYRGILIVGSGTSFNIGLSSKPVLEKYLNVPVKVQTPRTYAYYDYKFYDDYLILCISQSGRSTNTIDAVKRAQKQGNDVAAISMMPNSPISNYVKDSFEYGSYNGEGDSFVSKGFPTSFLYFSLFSIEAALKLNLIDQEKYDSAVAELEQIIEYMPKMREKSEEFYENNIEAIQNANRIMFAGIGAGFGLVQEACLKFSETTGIPTNGYETEEFLHGPSYEVKKDHVVFIMDLDLESSGLANKVFEAMKLLTDKVYMITDKRIRGNDVLSAEINVDDVLKPMLFVIPVQVIPSRICSDLNIRAITIYNHKASKLVQTKTDK